MGYQAGQTSQGANAVAVGRQAGISEQGASAVAIGAYAGVTGQGANSIILNGTGVALNTTTASSFHVKPVRGGNMTASALSYTSGGEIVEQTNMHFDGSGNVGIGTNAPSRILHLFKNATGSHYQRIQNVENNDGCGIELMRGNTTTFGATAYSDWRINNNAHLDFGVKFTGTDKPSVLHLNTNGFVGIGTDAPTNVLTIRGVSGKAFAMSDLRSNAVVKVQADYDADDGLFIGLIDRHSTLDGNNPSPYLQSNWDGSASVRPLLINPLGGGVGIGTLDPVSSLHIATTGDFSISNTADKSGVNERIGRILFYNGTNLAGAAIESCVNVGGANNNADIRFMTSYDNNTKLAERMRIDRAGNVGINQTTPLTTLDISGGFQSYSGRHVKTVPIRHNAYNDVAGNGGFVRVGDVVPGQGAGYSGSFAAFSWFGSSAITHGTGDRWNTPNRIRCCWRWGFVQGYVANVTFKLWETLYSTGDSLKATIASSNGSLSRGFTTVWGPPMTMIRGDVPGLKIEADSNTSGNASAPIRISDIWFEYVYV
jgi:hypothetical protein